MHEKHFTQCLAQSTCMITVSPQAVSTCFHPRPGLGSVWFLGLLDPPTLALQWDCSTVHLVPVLPMSPALPAGSCPAWELVVAPCCLVWSPRSSPWTAPHLTLPSPSNPHCRHVPIHQEGGFLSPLRYECPMLPPAIPSHPSTEGLHDLPSSCHILPPANSAPGSTFFSSAEIKCHPGVFKLFPM